MNKTPLSQRLFKHLDDNLSYELKKKFTSQETQELLACIVSWINESEAAKIPAFRPSRSTRSDNGLEFMDELEKL